MPSNIEIVELMQGVGHDRHEPEQAALYARHMASDLRVVEPDGLPYGGVFQGARDLAELDRLYGETWSASGNRRLRYAAVDAFVVCYLEATFTSRATGRRLDTTITEWWRLEDDRIVEIDIFYKDVAAVLATIAPDPD